MIDFQWLIGGEAGYGIMTTGYLMSKVLTRLALSVFDYTEYPSLIRGGHNAYYVRASDDEVFSQKREVDILVALNQETIQRHKKELSEKSIIIFDQDSVQLSEMEFPTKIILIPIPLFKLVERAKADKVMINTVSLGASAALINAEFKILENVIKDFFGEKGEKIAKLNILCAKEGYDYVKKNYPERFPFKIKIKNQENLLISGAEAISIGSIKAGLKFAAIYPMTPINAILLDLAKLALKYKIIVKEPEDEISGINMALGASFGGARSMVATSGGGFALMVESLGLSAQTETPIVIIEGMRPGPATGFPTWTEQGDLQFVLHAAHGDFPRIVVAPGDMLESFTYAMQAFNLAEKYQLPVIVLVDKYLMESHTTVQISNLKSQISKYKIQRGKILSNEELNRITDYKRYQVTSNGVSPRSLPGQKGGIGLSGSDEHDEKGLYNETSENRVRMVEKRFKKLKSALKDIPMPKFYGPKEANLTIISFGSTKMPILEALKILRNDGLDVNFLQISFLSPFPTREVEWAVKKAKKTLVIEGNYSGQLESLIKEKTGLSVTHCLRKFDGRPFYPEEIIARVDQII